MSGRQQPRLSRATRGPETVDRVVAAEELNATVLHYVADFDRLADVTGQRCTWVVPAGTIE